MGKEIYRDCQRNHACNLGGYAIDGCSEFIPSSNTLESHCRACGCHRNYHRKVLLVDLEVQQSPGKGHGHGCGKSFWSLREAKKIARRHHVLPVLQQNSGHQNFKQRKSKFSNGQREAMREFADSLGWTMRNKGRQAEIIRFCERIGVSRLLFKTWLNNNKKFYFHGTASTSGANNSSTEAVQSL